MVRLFTSLCILSFLSLTTVQATSPSSIYIDCPNDYWLYCGDEAWDLSIYGEPHVTSPNPYTIEGPVIQNHLNDCGVGHILRTWTIYDHYGSPYYCTQKLKFNASSSQIHVDWPDDYTTDVCGAATEPSDLPHGFDYPVITDPGGCSSIVMDHSDQTYVLNGTSCIKILRTWTVADWCVYHPRDNPHQGIWNYIQIIKVLTSDPPEITCPADITASSGDDCYRGYVQIPPATAWSDCAQNIHITNNSPYATNHGADASGNYPLGETWVQFKASDGCGHDVTCSMKVIVRDDVKPNPYCRHGLVTTLGWNEDGYYADVWADRFNIGSYDNCTAPEDLRFEISPSHFTCDDLGRNRVFFTVTDESGNRNTCETYVIIQDNMGMCPDAAHAPLVITGEIQAPDDTPLDNVQIVLNNSSSMTHMTNEEGQYAFVDMMRGQNYTVRPIRNDDILNGVTSMDLIIMLKHLLELDLITDPYQLIAADVDRSGDISVLDLYKLRNVLIGIDDEFPNNYSWRFMDANYEFIDGQDPLDEAIPQHYYIEDYDGPMTDLNFMGIKIGDLNGTSSNLIRERSSETIDIIIQDEKSSIAEEKTIYMSINDASLIEGFQVSLNYNTDLFEFAGLVDPVDGGLNGLKAYESRKGNIRLQYLTDFNTELDQISWGLLFNQIGSGKVIESIKLASDDIESEVYKSGNQIAQINLNLPSGISETKVNEIAVYPNPARDVLNLDIESAQQEEAAIQLFDMNGRVIMDQTVAMNKGYNNIQLDMKAFSNYSGIMVYKLVLNNKVIAGQFMKLEY